MQYTGIRRSSTTEYGKIRGFSIEGGVRGIPHFESEESKQSGGDAVRMR